MTSSPFERQIKEPETSERTSSSTNRMSDGPQQYQATASFLEHDRPSVRLVELPAWLQAFAASVGEPAESPPIVQDDSELDIIADSAPVPESQPDHMAESAHAGSFGTNFISEDDLPDWLRSIAPEEGQDSDTELFIPGGDENAEHLAVPNITRAWTTSKDARAVDESTSLFAQVASQASQSVLPATGAAGTGSRPQVGERSAANAQAEATGMVASYGSELPPDMASGLGHPASASADPDKKALRVKSPTLPIAVAGILLLVLVIVAIALFVL